MNKIWTIGHFHFENYITVALMTGKGNLEELREEFKEKKISESKEDWDTLEDFLIWIEKTKGWKHVESECLTW